MAIKGKKLRDHYKNTDRDKLFNLSEAVKLVREFASGGKSDQTIEIAMNLGVDPRHSDQMVRGVVLFAAWAGKSMKVAVFERC